MVSCDDAGAAALIVVRLSRFHVATVRNQFEFFHDAIFEPFIELHKTVGRQNSIIRRTVIAQHQTVFDFDSADDVFWRNTIVGGRRALIEYVHVSALLPLCFCGQSRAA